MSALFLARRATPSLSRAVTAVPAGARGIQGTIKSILHGSEEAKREGELEIQQHSKLVGRGKYIHAFEVHRVKPDQRDAYKAAAEEYYAGIASDASLHVKLTGSWETVVGELDTFVHILEYENYGGLDKSTELIRQSKVRKYHDAYNGILPHVTERKTQLCQEFAFLPSSPPRELGGLFELRSYSLKPGQLLDWEIAWRRGIDARKEHIRPVGAWFSQVGRLHQVHHIWQHKSLEERKATRELAWKAAGWSDTVVKTSSMVDHQDASIMLPLKFSPLK
ncbi:NIPSNAP-domain-containing protein [Clavulina sp. PMI_390]|nr:NIPSNAP-domain-containing protein [Clavulina sp. PMI_390]